MAITMVKDVFKRPHFQIKPTHIISRFLVPFLLIGIGILFYSSIQKGTLYEFPFSEEEIKEVNFFNILENDSVLVDDEVEIEALSKKEIVLMVGAGESMLECQDTSYKLSLIHISEPTRPY